MKHATLKLKFISFLIAILAGLPSSSLPGVCASDEAMLLRPLATAEREPAIVKRVPAEKRGGSASFDVARIACVDAYARYLRRRGLDDLVAVELAKIDSRISVYAILGKGKTPKRIYMADIQLDPAGRPMVMNGRKGKQISLTAALRLSGIPEEIFIYAFKHPDGTNYAFATGNVHCNLTSFLRNRRLRPKDIKVVRYLPSDLSFPGGRRLEIRKTKGMSLTSGELLASIDIAENGRPLGIADTAPSASVLNLAGTKTLHPDTKRFGFSKGVEYTGIDDYIDYVSRLGIGTIVRTEARLSENSIEIHVWAKEGGTVKEKVIHKITIDQNGIPDNINPDRLLVQRPAVSLLRTLRRQGQVDPEQYRRFAFRDRAKPLRYPSEEEARQALKDVMDSHPGITVTYLKIHHSAIYRACQRFGIPMPYVRNKAAAVREKGGPRVDFLAERLKQFSGELKSDEELEELYNAAYYAPDENSAEAARTLFIEAMRPLIRDVIERELRLEFTANMFMEELIEDGEVAVWEEMRGFQDTSETITAYYRRILTQRLNKTFRKYSSEIESRRRPSLDQPAGETTLRELIKPEFSIDTGAALSPSVDPAAVSAAATTMAQQAGIPIILGDEKRALSNAMSELLARDRTFKALAKRPGARWAVITHGSMGNLGTAAKRHCDWNTTIFSDLSNEELAEAMRDIAEAIDGEPVSRNSDIPTIFIGRGADYGAAAGELGALLTAHGIGSPQRGLMTIEAVSVNDDYVDAATPEGREIQNSGIRALMHVDPDISPKIGSNGHLLMESAEGTAQSLARDLRRNIGPAFEENENYRLQVEFNFFNSQRKNLQEALLSKKIAELLAKRMKGGGAALAAARGLMDKYHITVTRPQDADEELGKNSLVLGNSVESGLNVNIACRHNEDGAPTAVNSASFYCGLDIERNKWLYLATIHALSELDAVQKTMESGRGAIAMEQLQLLSGELGYTAWLAAMDVYNKRDEYSLNAEERLRNIFVFFKTGAYIRSQETLKGVPIERTNNALNKLRREGPGTVADELQAVLSAFNTLLKEDAAGGGKIARLLESYEDSYDSDLDELAAVEGEAAARILEKGMARFTKLHHEALSAGRRGKSSQDISGQHLADKKLLTNI